jgi:hypothetical protein
MAFTGRGGQSGGPQYGWGNVPNDPGAGSGGLSRYSQDYGVAEQSFRGAGGGFGYARDYDRGFRGHEGGNGRGLTFGSGNRSGRGEYDQGFRAGPNTFGGGNRSGRGDTSFRGVAPAFGGQYGVGNEYADRYDRELRAGGHTLGGGGRTGGQYDGGYPAMGGGHTLGAGGSPRYGADFGGYGGQMDRGGYQEVTYGFAPRQSSGGYEARPSGGYGAGGGQRGGYGREFGQGRALSGRGGGYDAGYSARPLTDDEFYSRVNRW